MKLFIFSIVVVVLIVGVVFVDGYGIIICMGIEGVYEFYNFINDNGEVDGFEIELGNELCVCVELICEWVINDWDLIIFNFVLGNYDIIMVGMLIIVECDEVIDFS